jgi:hypothetical protein
MIFKTKQKKILYHPELNKYYIGFKDYTDESGISYWTILSPKSWTFYRDMLSAQCNSLDDIVEIDDTFALTIIAR